ncbi:alpha/beta fold hydrolase [Isoptericola sp. G70]|uniref:alpha/beta fold hydrolase n=1 Tax=Isoptericola sp. G70 TaxID=3376633 RepID=UPI003A7F8DCB
MSITSTSEYTIPGAHVTDRTLTVPLDWADPDDDRTLSLFVREVVAPQRRGDDLPLLVFLQGGPGGKGPRPTGPDGWLGKALERFRVVLLDQRGTGRSTAVRAAALQALGSPEAQAEHLSHFRADSIVLDAEHVRREVYDGRRWSTLGQSYGGFLTLTYLSLAPEGVAASYVTGGLAGLTASADDVYGRTQPRVVAKNALFRERYPQDVERIGRIADRIAAGDVRLPGGDLLTVERFQSLGMAFGMGPGFERVHWIVDEAFDDLSAPGAADTLTDTFLAEVESATGFATNPLYAVLHESIYAQAGTGPTAWAAQRVRDGDPTFAADARPLLFTGEMIYPWMFDQVAALRPFRAAAEALAARDGWRDLYDLDVLAANEVPLEAAVYHDDMFVDADLSLDTAARVGNARAWVTNEFEHDGLRAGDVFTTLLDRLDARGGPLREPEDVRSFGWFAYAPESGEVFRPDDMRSDDADATGDAAEVSADSPVDPPSPRTAYEVRLANDYSCDWPLWSDLPARIEDALDDALRARLRAWADVFQEHFDPFDGWDDAAVADEHRGEGERLRDALRAALPWPWTVRLEAWEHRLAS